MGWLAQFKRNVERSVLHIFMEAHAPGWHVPYAPHAHIKNCVVTEVFHKHIEWRLPREPRE